MTMPGSWLPAVVGRCPDCCLLGKIVHITLEVSCDCRFKRIEESLDHVQRLLVDHLHALRLQFSTARELCAGLAACARADAAHAFRHAAVQSAIEDGRTVTDHLEATCAAEPDASTAETAPTLAETDAAAPPYVPGSLVPADDSAADGVVPEDDLVAGTALAHLIPSEFLDAEELPAAVLHPRLKAQGAALERVAAALMFQKRTHEAVGYACIRSAERLMGAAALAPITRLRDALRRLRPIMEKRRRYQTDVDAYNRRVREKFECD